MNRRQFLRTVGGLTGVALFGEFFPGLTLYAEPKRAGDESDHFFVLLRTFGGMDVTLGLDPQILPAGADSGDLFLEYRPDEVVQAGGIRLGRPTALAPFANDCLVLKRDHDAAGCWP